MTYQASQECLVEKGRCGFLRRNKIDEHAWAVWSSHQLERVAQIALSMEY